MLLFVSQMPSQFSSAPAPKPVAPPPTAPKPTLSFLPPPEMGDRPPPAPWAEELRARTTQRQANQKPASAPAQPPAKAASPAPPLVKTPASAPPLVKTPASAPPLVKAPASAPPLVKTPASAPPLVKAPASAPPLVKAPAPAIAPKSSFASSQHASFSPKAANSSAGSRGSSPGPAAFIAPKPVLSSSYTPPSPPPAVAPSPPASAPFGLAVNHSKRSPIGSQENLRQPSPPAPQPKPVTSPGSSNSQLARSPAKVDMASTYFITVI